MTNAGGYRISGLWGSAWDSQGNLIAEMVSLSTPVQLGRIDVPIVGSMRTGHKPGRETRDGTLRVQKIDSAWEMYMYGLLSQTADQRRAARDGRAARVDPEFTLVLKYDDPDALGVERWQLDGCRLWALPLGFDINTELVENEFPVTWESETPLTAFKATLAGSRASAQYLIGNP